MLRPLLTTDRTIAKGHRHFELPSAVQFRRMPNVHISHDLRRWIHPQDATPEFDAKSNVPTSFRDFECPTTRTDENTRRELFEEMKSTAEGNASQRQNLPTGSLCPPEPSHNHPRWKREARRISLSQTLSQLYSTIKMRREMTRLTAKRSRFR